MKTTTKLKMHNPTHPGLLIKADYIDHLGLTITECADRLCFSRKTLSFIINGRASITPKVAIRLSLAFGSTPEFWLNMQTRYDLWQAQQVKQPKIERYVLAGT